MKIAKKASKGLKEKVDEKYMNGIPTRLEVSNYINALLEEKYLPMFQNMVQMSTMILQGILIRKGLCTGQEIEEITKEFMAENEKRLAANQTINSTELLKEVLTVDYLNALKNHVLVLTSSKLSFETPEVVDKITSIVKPAVEILEKLINTPDNYSLEDKEREEILKDLVDIKRQVESGEIKFTKIDDKSKVLGMLWDMIIPFAHKHLGTFAKYGKELSEDNEDSVDKVK